MRKTPVVRATLIQSISELMTCWFPYLYPLVEKYAYEGAEYEDALKWIIAEELEIIYGLFDERHQPVRRSPPYHDIYCELRPALPLELSRYISYYVQAPRIYHEHNTVRLDLQGQDLYLYYFRSPYDPIDIRNYPILL